VTTTAHELACDYCGLPVPVRRRARAAAERPSRPVFCCSGCRFAASILSADGDGDGDGHVRRTMLKLGLAIFFAMNVMVFSMALWTSDVYGNELQAGGPLADAVGPYKEIEDSRGGSGFSFNDIATNRAGTRFGEYAANPALAQKLQRQLSMGIGEKDIMPATDDLPESLPEKEFLKRFGGIGAPPYKKMMADIERRIAALPLYR